MRDFDLKDLETHLEDKIEGKVEVDDAWSGDLLLRISNQLTIIIEENQEINQRLKELGTEYMKRGD